MLEQRFSSGRWAPNSFREDREEKEYEEKELYPKILTYRTNYKILSESAELLQVLMK